MRHVALACLLSALVATFSLGGCGRTELDYPEDVPHPDVPTPDVPTPDGGCVSNTQCDNGVFCDGTELCIAGVCVSSAPVNCDDGVACTDDRCDEPTRVCVHAPDAMLCPVGQTCDVSMGCTATGCTSNAMCDDGDPCNGVETCAAGRCVRSAPPVCDDGIPCTSDACVTGRGCVSTPVDARCDNGVFCDGAERCTVASHGCTRGVPVDCADGNACTQDVCDNGVSACLHPPTDADGDGFPPIACRGTDCNDADPRINPGATEVCNNGIDDNCDGRADCADPFCAADPACIAVCMPTGPEDTMAACHDGRDDDCNGAADCADMGCVPFCGCVPTGPENNPMACTDGVDNDCNGLTDCADPGCGMLPFCRMCVPRGPENTAAACANGVDDDCNGLVDCSDPACAMTTPCITPPPNDTCAMPTPITVPGSASGSTTAAHDDFNASCAPSSPAPDVVYTFTTTTTETIRIDTFGSTYDTVLFVRRTNCTTGPDVACDDDSPMGLTSQLTLTATPPGTYFVFVDGFAASSGSYQLHITLVPPEICHNGIDDDGNGLIDCADPACATDPGCRMCVPTGPENNATACHDGRDDDCNGTTDCADLQCAPFCMTCVPTGPENTPPACTDGRDNDCDGLVDCADPQCGAFPFCMMCVPRGPENTPSACTNGLDDNCNGLIDCADPSCAAVPACVTPPPNDTCASPTTIGVPGNASGSTVAAHDDFDASCATSTPAPDVVYTFTNPVTQTIVVDTFGSAYDTVLIVRRTNCAVGPDVACDDDSSMGVTSQLTLTAAPPGTYFVIVDGFGGSSGAYQLHITLPPEICNNGVDDNGNGLIDCADPACAADPTCGRCVPTGPENTRFRCTDGRDNDCNGLIDCADPGCARFPVCMTCRPTGPENTAAACGDGLDNDCDGRIDCADPDCSGIGACACVVSPENTDATCADGRDNDCDRLVDCADPDCAMTTPCRMCVPTGAENTAATCADGRDNNCNGLTDCADPGCAMIASCCRMRTEVCNDSVDNNCDGLVDCADPECAASPLCARCVPTATRELGVAACTNGLDDDCDGLIDCADPDCQPFPGAMSECCNGRDDNGNGVIDEFACACMTNTQCVGIGSGGRFPSNTCYASTLSVCGPACNTLGGDLFCNGLLPGSHCDVVTGECM